MLPSILYSIWHFVTISFLILHYMVLSWLFSIPTLFVFCCHSIPIYLLFWQHFCFSFLYQQSFFNVSIGGVKFSEFMALGHCNCVFPLKRIYPVIRSVSPCDNPGRPMSCWPRQTDQHCRYPYCTADVCAKVCSLTGMAQSGCPSIIHSSDSHNLAITAYDKVWMFHNCLSFRLCIFNSIVRLCWRVHSCCTCTFASTAFECVILSWETRP